MTIYGYGLSSHDVSSTYICPLILCKMFSISAIFSLVHTWMGERLARPHQQDARVTPHYGQGHINYYKFAHIPAALP